MYEQDYLDSISDIHALDQLFDSLGRLLHAYKRVIDGEEYPQDYKDASFIGYKSTQLGRLQVSIRRERLMPRMSPEMLDQMIEKHNKLTNFLNSYALLEKLLQMTYENE